MTSIKTIAFGLIAISFAAVANVATAQEARITVGDLSNSAQRAAFEQALTKTANQFCGRRDDNLGHLTGAGQADDYKTCASAVRDEAFAQLSQQRRAQYAAAAADSVMIASAR